MAKNPFAENEHFLHPIQRWRLNGNAGNLKLNTAVAESWIRGQISSLPKVVQSFHVQSVSRSPPSLVLRPASCKGLAGLSVTRIESDRVSAVGP